LGGARAFCWGGCGALGGARVVQPAPAISARQRERLERAAREYSRAVVPGLTVTVSVASPTSQNLVKARCDMTLEEYVLRFQLDLGITVSTGTVFRGLATLKMTRKRTTRSAVKKFTPQNIQRTSDFK